MSVRERKEDTSNVRSVKSGMKNLPARQYSASFRMTTGGIHGLELGGVAFLWQNKGQASWAGRIRIFV